MIVSVLASPGRKRRLDESAFPTLVCLYAPIYLNRSNPSARRRTIKITFTKER